MRPAQQRLAGLDPAGLEVEQRLIVQVERVALQRLAQIEFQISARLGGRFHFALEPQPLPAPLGFRPIERQVGVAQELILVDAMGGGGDADAGGDGDLVAVEIVSAGDRFQDRSRQRFALIERGERRLQDHELVAAEAEMTSASRTATRSRSATACNSMSPRVCPKVSLTCLNWSRSTK